MSSRSSLDHDWEFAGAHKSPGNSLSDDDLESLPTSAATSELGDDPWEDDNEPVAVETIPKPMIDDLLTRTSDPVENTPLQTARALSDDEEGDEGLSSMQGSEDSSANSTFSFHFPDPLDASRQFDTYAQLCEQPNESEAPESDMETDSVAGTDILSGDDAKEPSLALDLLKPSVATPAESPKQEAAPGIYSPIAKKRRMSYLGWNFRTGLFILITSLVAAICLYRLGRRVPPRTPLISSITNAMSSNPTNTPKVVDTPTVLSAAVRPDGTSVKRLPALIDGREQYPAIAGRSQRLMLEAPPSTGFFIGSFDFPSPKEHVRTSSLSLNPIKKITNSISTTFHSFSRIVLRDLRDVLEIIDELLIFIRDLLPVESIQQHSRSLLDYITNKIADRHEHAKQNARILTAKTMALARVASAELALRQEAAVENAKHVWNEVKSWTK